MGLPGPSILGDTSRSDTKLDELGLAAEPTALVDTDRIPILDLLMPRETAVVLVRDPLGGESASAPLRAGCHWIAASYIMLEPTLGRLAVSRP